MARRYRGGGNVDDAEQAYKREQGLRERAERLKAREGRDDAIFEQLAKRREEFNRTVLLIDNEICRESVCIIDKCRVIVGFAHTVFDCNKYPSSYEDVNIVGPCNGQVRDILERRCR